MQLVAGLSRGSREIRLIMDPPDQRWGRPSSYPTLGRSVRGAYSPWEDSLGIESVTTPCLYNVAREAREARAVERN